MPRRRTPELEIEAAKRAAAKAHRGERHDRIREALATGVPLRDLREANLDLWPEDEAGRMRWRRDLASVCPPSPKPAGTVVAAVERPEPLVLLPSVPCARVMHSTMQAPGIPLEMPGGRNARLWDGRAGTASIVPPSKIRNRAPLSAAPAPWLSRVHTAGIRTRYQVGWKVGSRQVGPRPTCPSDLPLHMRGYFGYYAEFRPSKMTLA